MRRCPPNNSARRKNARRTLSGQQFSSRLERRVRIENCNCDVVCPCGASGFTAPADYDRCNAMLAWHIDSGEVDGTDASGLSVLATAVQWDFMALLSPDIARTSPLPGGALLLVHSAWAEVRRPVG